MFRAVTKALIGGGRVHIHIFRVLPDEFLLKSTVMTTDFKRNSSGRTPIYEYPPPPPPINALVTALPMFLCVYLCAMYMMLKILQLFILHYNTSNVSSRITIMTLQGALCLGRDKESDNFYA